MKNLHKIAVTMAGITLMTFSANAGTFGSGPDMSTGVNVNPQGHVELALSIVSDRPTGWNTVQVNYNGGQFFQSGSRWTERNANGSYHFKEFNRDDWSVYLYDAGRDVTIQLDLHRKMIFYSDNNTRHMPLYRITGASSGGAVIRF